MDTKGHIFEVSGETPDSKTWQCSKCGALISFVKNINVEPHTTGELPENTGEYLDQC